MVVKKVFRRLIAGSVILTLFFSSLLCPTPLLFPAKAAPAREYQGSDVIHILNSLLRQTAAENQTQQAAAGSLQEGQADLNPPDPNFIENNNQSGLPQEEIDRIINEHLLAQNKEAQAPKQVVKQQPQDLADLEDLEDQQIDRFIIKYRNEKQKEKTSLKVKDIIKERKPTKNSKFDVFVTKDKMRKEDFSALLKQKEADPNIEYIQPDYQLSVASGETSPDEKPELPADREEPRQEDNSTPKDSNETQTDTQAPTLSDITFDGLKIELTYDETLKSASISSDSNFSVKNQDGQTVAIAGIDITNNKVEITLGAPQANAEAVVLSYTPGTKPITDPAGNPAAGFFGRQVQASPEITADTAGPLLKTAEVKDNIITLGYNEALLDSPVPLIADYSLVCKDEKGKPLSVKIKKVTITDKSICLTLEDSFAPDRTMEISYMPGENPVTDPAGNPAAGFSNQEISNQTETVDLEATILQEATINNTELVLSFNEELKEDSLPENNDFSLKLNGQALPDALQKIRINGKKVIITVTEPVAGDDVLKLSYLPGTMPLLDLAGNEAEPFSDIIVNNVTALEINDPRYGEQWALRANTIDEDNNQAVSVGINAADAWQEAEGEGVVIAVLDTGIDITHEDLEDNIWTNTAEIPANGLDDDGNGYIDDLNGWNFVDKTNAVHNPVTIGDEWHGTHVAGIIAAETGNEKGIAGVAPKAKIMPLQVFKNGTAYTSDIISAIVYAEQNGAQIVNCSWGSTSENAALKEAIEESGLLFVCAAGNSHNDIDLNPVYPASLSGDNIISVASVKENGNLSRFSNYGRTFVDVAAPGEEILSTTPGNVYGQSGGTSQAAAFVTGEAALIMSKYPNADISEIRTRIIISADKLSSLTEKAAGGGIINCASALADPVTPNDNIIEIEEETVEDPGSGSPDDGDYDLYSVDEWNMSGNMLTARRYFGAVTFNDKIYSVGGNNTGTTYLNSVEIFDPISGTSTYTGSLNTAGYGLGVAVTDSKIYAIGGYNGGYKNTLEEYNPETNTWSTKASMPTARRYLGVAAVNGKIYAIGGRNSSALNTVEEYDPATDTWSTKASMPTARYGLGIVAVNENIYTIGGYNSTYKNNVEVYNTVTNTWTAKASMPLGLGYLGAVAINGKIFTMGGYNGSEKRDTYEYNPDADAWGKRADLATARYGLGAAAANGKIFALGGYNGSYLNTVEVYGLPTNKWQTLNNMSVIRSELGTTAVNGKIYALGGYNGTTYLNTVEEYDKTTNAWTTKANMPTARSGLGVAAVNGKIYAIGGYNGNNLNTVEEYNPATNTWTSRANIPSARRYFGLTVLNGKLYAVGGYNGTAYLNTVEEYDPATNTWVTKANLSTARGYLGVSAANGKIYAIGGYNGSTYLNKVEEYNPVTNTWATKAVMPAARRGLGAETVSGKIYAIGGYNGTSYLQTVEQYDPNNNTWITLNKEKMLVGREKFGSTSLDGKIYTLGGYNGAYCNTVEVYTPTVNPWAIKANMPTARCYFSAATVNGKIYAIGGEDSERQYINTVEEYDPVTNTWSTKASMPTARYQFGLATFNDKIYAFGGYNGSLLNTVEEYDPVTNTWSTKASMPTARMSLKAVTVNGKIYIVYGDIDNVSVEEYDPVSNTWSVKEGLATTGKLWSATAAYNGKIYVFGGCDTDFVSYMRAIDTVVAYDTVTNTWSSKNNAPTARYAYDAITVHGKIYAIAGYNRSGYLNTVEEYDPNKDIWAPLTGIPTARANLAVAEANGKIYAIGGNNSIEISNSVEEYDLGISTWNTKANMTTARGYLGAAAVNGKIYAIGGYNGGYRNVIEEYSPETNTWSAKASMTTARGQLGVVSSGNLIYAIGGYNGAYQNKVEVYDPLTNTWSTKANLQTARRQLGVAAVNGKIYAIGGYNGNGLNTVEMYDPTTNTWTTKASMPTARYGMGVAVVNGKIYVLGGYNNQALKTVEVYDPGTNTWTTKTSMPTARTGLGAAVVNEMIYALGGADGAKYLDANEEYDPVNDCWSERTGMMTSRAVLGVVPVDNLIYAIGGIRIEPTTVYLPTVEVYDPSIDSYREEKSDNTIARSSLGVTEVDGNIYAIGGYNGSTYLNTVEKYYGSWSTMAAMPTARKDLGVTAVNGKVYAIGGYNGNYLNTVEVYDPATNTWSSKAGMITARSGLGVTTVNGRIYAIGGCNSSGNLNNIEEYDPTTDTWIAKASMPTARTNLSVVGLNGLIYAIGGKNSIALGTIEKYDPVSNTWTTGAYMPTPRYALGTAAVNGKIYAIGGYDDNNYLSVSEEYDPSSNTWTANINALNPRANYGAVCLAGKIYLVDGYNNTGYLNTVEVYNPGKIYWSTLANLPLIMNYLGVAEANGKIYAIGGRDSNNNVLSTVQEYDPSSNTWSAKLSMPTARYRHAVAVVNEKIYVIGGYGGSTLNKVEAYDPSTNTWSSKTSMPTARYALGAATINGKIYTIGGRNGSGYLTTVEEYDPATDTWRVCTGMPTGKGNLGVVALNGKIYAIGGYNGSSYFNKVEEYDPVANTWSTKANMIEARMALSLAPLNGKIYAIGGLFDRGTYAVETKTVEVFDPATNTWNAEAELLERKSYFGATTLNGKIYVIGGGNNDIEVGSFEDEMNDSIAELIHLGEENVNLSGNFSRTYTDMKFTAPGFEIDLSRTYNSRDDRSAGAFNKGWSFGFQGSLANYLTNQIIARLPNGSALTFTQNGSTYTANDSRATLVKQTDNSYILTTKDQYTYGFSSSGWLTWMKDRNGNTITLTVNATTGKVTRLTDQVGRQINMTYNAQGYLSTITDPAGRIVQYEYASNRLVRAIDPMGKITRYSYNAEGYLSEIRDHDNNLIESIIYDNSAGSANIRIARLTDAYGNSSTYMYDTDNRKVTITDLNGREKITWYDSSLYPIQVQDPDGRRSTTVYSLDANNVNKYGEAMSKTDRNGNKAEYQRDANGNITKTYNPDSSYKEYAYDSKNNVISEKDENGKYTFYVYDTNKINLLKKAQPLNGTDQYTPGCDESLFAITTYAYYTNTEAQQQFNCNAKGLLKSETDPNGQVTTYTYDTYGNVKTVKDAENKTTTYNYNNIGWKTSVVTPKGYTTTYVYDLNGNLEKETLQGGEVTRTTYDNRGRKTKVVAPNLYEPTWDNLTNHTYSGDHGYRYTYYPSGKVQTETEPEGNTTSYSYDLYGNILTETKPNGSVIEYYYDSLARLSAVKFKETAGTEAVLLAGYTYLILSDGRTQKTETRYLNENETAVTQYIYDYQNRLLQQTKADGTVKTTSYNANGTLYSATDERGYSTYYRYDGLNRNTAQWLPAATEGTGNTLYTYKETVYDKAGNIIATKIGKTALALFAEPAAGDFITQSKEYYNNNKLKLETDSSGGKTEYQYDNDGCLSKKEVYTSLTAKNTTEYINNYLGKPVTKKLHVREGDLFGYDFAGNTDTVLTTANTYDKNGNLKTVTRPDNVVITYTYDNLDRQTSMSMPGVDENNNPATITTSKTYDWAGKVLTETDANGQTATNIYDKQERLIKVSDALGNTGAFYYDRAGRLLAEVDKNSYDAGKSLSEMNRTLYTYDAMDRIKTRSYVYLDPVSSQWVSYIAKAFQYDAQGNLSKELDALGYEAGTGSTIEDKINSGYGTEYTYDPANCVLTILDPVSKDCSLSYTTKYDYDGAGRKITETNANGVVTAYTYDDAGNPLTTAVTSQLVQTNTYDLAGNLLTQTDGNGNMVTNQYNAWDKLKQTVYPGDPTIPSCTITYQYDVNGNLKEKSNTAGVADLYTYDNQGRELSHTRQKSDGTQGLSTSIRYDKAGNKRFVVDGNGVTTENLYNAVNKLTGTLLNVTRADSSTVQHATTYGYDKNGNLTTTTNLLGTSELGTSTNIYDPLNRLIEKKDPLNKSLEKLTYNHNNLQVTSTDALNKTTQFTYDKNKRLLATSDPLNHVTSRTYDNVGNVRTKTDGAGNVTTFNYDSFNRLTSVVNAKNETTSYTYDLNGNLLTQTDGLNHTTTYEYNAANQPTKKIDHGGRTGTYPDFTYDSAKTESYTYDAFGNLLTKLDRNGQTTTYTYDVHNRMLSQTVGSITISSTYDGNGNQLTLTDSTGTTTRTYDQLNRTKTKTVPGISGSFTFLYDLTGGLPSGQVAETDTDPKGNVTTQVFDQAGRMISVTAGGNTTAYTYYDNGSKHTVVYPGGTYEEYTYTDDGLLQTLVNKRADQSVLDSYAYTYDAAHNMTSKVDAKGTTSYTYDDLNRLLTVTEPGQDGKVTAYTYDAAGNRATQTETVGTVSDLTSYTYNEQNRLTNTLTQQNSITTQTAAYTYDNNGNQLTVSKVPYVNGVPQTAQVTTCTYDLLNQLATTNMPDSTSLVYIYNGEGLRVAKQVNGVITKYLYVNDKVVLELDGSNNQIARNVQGTSLISRTVSGVTLYYMYNGHADVTALVDSSGTVQATYYYDAFGNVKEQTGNFSNNILYAGYQYDKESGLYYLNSRYYDPVIARFLTEDTFRGNKNDPLSLNLYTYCHNEPLMYSDPTGHNWLSSTITAIKSVVSVVAKIIGMSSNSHSSSSGDSSSNKSKNSSGGSSSNKSKNGSGGFLSNIVNTISNLIFGNSQSSGNIHIQNPLPASLLFKPTGNLNSNAVSLYQLFASTDLSFMAYQGMGNANTFSIQSYQEPKKNRLIIVGLPGEHGRLFELAANTYKQEHSNDDVKIIYAKDYKSMDELLDASSKAFDKGFWGNIFDNNEIDDLVYYGHSYSPGEGLEHGGLSVFYKSGRNDSWITENTDLSMLDFNNGATIHLYGCDGGVVGPKGENSIAQDLANKTGATAYGYTSKSSFTSDPVLGHGQRNISDKEKLSPSVKGENIWLVPNNNQPMTEFTPVKKPWYQFW